MSKVRVGFVGVGGIAATHLKNLSVNDDVNIAAVCDIVEANAKRIGEEHGATAYSNADDMLEKEALDALFICVPPFAHGDLEEKAAQRGIHLLVEKPVSLSMEEAQRKQAVIDQAGIICATGYCLRYLDTVKKAKEYLEGKEVAMVRGHYITSFVETPWYRTMSKSGGQLVEQATHTLDLIRYFGGEIDKVYANMALKVSNEIENMDIPDVTSVNVTFENGAVGHLDCSITQTDHRMGVEVLGKNFRVSIDGTELTIVEDGKVTSKDSEVDFYEEQDKAFIEAIVTGKTDGILSDYTNGMKTLEVSLAANESQASGKVVSFP